MKKILLFLSLFFAASISTNSVSAQRSGPAEIRTVPPAVQQTWQEQMFYYMQVYDRYGITTWFMDKGTFLSVTVFHRWNSNPVRLFMYFDPQGRLLGAGTDE